MIALSNVVYDAFRSANVGYLGRREAPRARPGDARRRSARRARVRAARPPPARGRHAGRQRGVTARAREQPLRAHRSRQEVPPHRRRLARPPAFSARPKTSKQTRPQAVPRPVPRPQAGRGCATSATSPEVVVDRPRGEEERVEPRHRGTDRAARGWEPGRPFGGTSDLHARPRAAGSVATSGSRASSARSGRRTHDELAGQRVWTSIPISRVRRSPV
jgi:hypothetical protein